MQLIIAEKPKQAEKLAAPYPSVKRDGYIVCNYDRGWDIEPTDENTQLALELLLHSENW